jgi:hypothetical protein
MPKCVQNAEFGAKLVQCSDWNIADFHRITTVERIVPAGTLTEATKAQMFQPEHFG